MVARSVRSLFAGLVVVMLFYSIRPLLSCGPFFGETIFTYKLNPELPLDRFAQGNLGIIQPTYARSYLYVAYRYLMGKSFNQEEQKCLVDFWDARLSHRWENEGSKWIEPWLSARSKVQQAGPSPEIKVYSGEYWFFGYLIYPEDAFQNAAKTLNERIERFGPGSPEVLDWVQAQDMIFAEYVSIPEPARPGVDPLLQADRAYQIAAANFYAGNFHIAEKMFREIANDDSSPWNKIAPYMVARTLIRKATLQAEPGKAFDESVLKQAETELKGVLGNDSLKDMHPAADRLLRFVNYRLHPDRTLHELSQVLLRENLGFDLKLYLTDYTKLLDKFEEESWESRSESTLKKLMEFSKTWGDDDLTDWIFTFQASGDAALEHALQRWDKTSSSPWLIASLTKIHAGHPRLSELLTAAAGVKSDSPEYASVAFQSIRLMIESGNKDEARRKLDVLLDQVKSAIPTSSHNLFLAERMKVARNLDEFVKFALRTSVGFSYEDEMPELHVETQKVGKVKFDADFARIINEKMPLSIIREVSVNEALSDDFRREIAMAVYVRAVLLGDEDVSRGIAPVLSDLAPELREYLDAYTTAKDRESRQFAAVFMILKFPGMCPYVRALFERETPLDKIDDLRDNWWCPFGQSQPQDWGYYQMRTSITGPLAVLYPGAGNEPPDFLNQAQRAAAEAEWSKLTSLQTAPNYLCAQVLDFAKKNPKDPRVPESLHLAVRSTRYGCTDDQTTQFSKQAFQLLHRKYPKSSWTAKTKYWY